MAANPNAMSRPRLSVRKPAAELQERKAPPVSAVTDPAARPTPTDAVADAASQTSRHEEIACTAYYMAEARGFEPGHELEDWLAAEQQTGTR